MTNIIETAIKALEEKLQGKSVDFSAKFEIENEGSIIVDNNGVRASSEDTDCTLIASAETFQDILSGETNPTSAFMSGHLKVEGSMGVAMQLGNIIG
ncbi:MAG: SCP2 sterol-binding domain-containing protein [Paracoccaceae bacterium]|nr:SCP2 sterol-binding domain-containing protein [Paracoccaceae bacterium]